MAIHSGILAWRIPRNRGAWQATVQGMAESDRTEQLTLQLHLCKAPKVVKFIKTRNRTEATRGWGHRGMNCIMD